MHRRLDTLLIEQLLVLNDMLNNVVAKFNDVKKGLFDTQYEMSGKQPTQTVNNPEPRQAISLIDLDDDPPTATTTNSNNINELNDLFGTASISAPQAQPAQSGNDIFDLLGQPTTTSPSHSIPSPSLQNTGTLQQKQQSPASSTTNANIETSKYVFIYLHV
jgi:hypothetical protein